MKKSANILLFLMAFLLAGITGAHASVSHDHHGGISDSPFQGNSKDHSLHCQLNKHHPLGQACPHIRARGVEGGIRIAVDCGGNSNGTVPAVPNPGESQFMFSAVSLLPVLKSAENIFTSSEFFQHFYPESLDPPPRSS